MKSDLTTKILLSAIALGLLANAWRLPARPVNAAPTQSADGQPVMTVVQIDKASNMSGMPDIFYDDVHIINNGKYYHFTVNPVNDDKRTINAGIQLR